MQEHWKDGFVDLIGLRIVETKPDIVRATIDIDERHLQPYGIVHGGVYATIVESLGSHGGVAWALTHDRAGVVGISNTTDFYRMTRSGRLLAEARPVHQGRTQQVWLVEITRESDGKLVARGQVRLQNMASLEAGPTGTSGG